MYRKPRHWPKKKNWKGPIKYSRCFNPGKDVKEWIDSDVNRCWELVKIERAIGKKRIPGRFGCKDISLSGNEATQLVCSTFTGGVYRLQWKRRLEFDSMEPSNDTINADEK